MFSNLSFSKLVSQVGDLFLYALLIVGVSMLLFASEWYYGLFFQGGYDLIKFLGIWNILAVFFGVTLWKIKTLY